MTKSHLTFHLNIAAMLLLCAASLDFLVLSVRADSAAISSSNSAARPTSTNSHFSPESLSLRVQGGIQKIRPSLVTIGGLSQGPADHIFTPFLPEFSDGDFNPFSDATSLSSIFSPERSRSCTSTGVIVSEDGFIWTSHEVVRDQESVTVTLQDHSSYAGKVVYRDPDSGIGILKIDAEKLPAVKFGETSNLRPADWVVAIAVDDDLEPSISAGMVSGVKRPVTDSSLGKIRCSFPLPTDFAGCPLINLDGELIGINATIGSEGGNSLAACNAFDSSAASKIQQKAVQLYRGGQQNEIQQLSELGTAAFGQSNPKRKEGKLTNFENVIHLFSVPSPEWISGSITSSIRNWVGSWQGADHPFPHPASTESESR